MSILQGLDPQAIAKAFDPKNAIDVADYKNCKLIECQKCGFRFDAAHCFSDGTYDCPVCNESDLGAQLVALEKRIAELERERDAAIAELDNVKKHYRSVIGDEIMRLEAECDAANKRADELQKAFDELHKMHEGTFSDARKLAQNWNGVMTSVELEAIVKKYLQQ